MSWEAWASDVEMTSGMVTPGVGSPHIPPQNRCSCEWLVPGLGCMSCIAQWKWRVRK